MRFTIFNDKDLVTMKSSFIECKKRVEKVVIRSERPVNALSENQIVLDWAHSIIFLFP